MHSGDWKKRAQQIRAQACGQRHSPASEAIYQFQTV